MPVLNNLLDEVIMFAQHTPGPWSCSWSLAGKWLVYIGEKVFSFDQEDEADARLIAEAPALYEVLRELVTLEADGMQAAESAIEVWERARAAVAKAAGVKP